jgi:hypothetical protein
VAVILISPHQMQHADQGNHGQNRHICTPPSIVGYFYFKSFQHIFFPNIFSLSHNLSNSSPNFSIKPKTSSPSQSYFFKIVTATMSQPSQQISSPNTSPTKSSPSKTTTTIPNVTENTSVPLPQPSDIITDATPLTMIHPSFASILNPKPSNSSPSPKPKPKKRTKSATTKKPKSQKSKSRYSSNFDMQKLYLDDLGNASTNVA